MVATYLVVQNDPRRKQDVDKQVEISEKQRFVNHHVDFVFGFQTNEGTPHHQKTKKKRKQRGFFCCL